LATQASDAAIPNSPAGAPARLNCWCSHFENAIKAATSVHALQTLQGLTCPAPKLAKKIQTKITQLGFPNPGNLAGVPLTSGQSPLA
jgi:hypothetical protein